MSANVLVKGTKVNVIQSNTLKEYNIVFHSISMNSRLKILYVIKGFGIFQLYFQPTVGMTFLWDCLFLNVHCVTVDTTTKKPVHLKC